MNTLDVQSTTGSGAYMGTVKLVLKKGSRPYGSIRMHNAGTAEFFEYILNSVKGDVLPNDRPGLVKLIYKWSNSETDPEIVSSYGVLGTGGAAKSTGTVENPKATSVYHFMIPETIVLEGMWLYGLELDSINKVKYATVKFPEVIEITKNTNIELDWELNITNK